VKPIVVLSRPVVVPITHMSLFNIIVGAGALLSGLAVAGVCFVGCLVWFAGLAQHLSGSNR